MKTLILGLGRIASLLEKDPLRYHPCTHSGVILSSKLKSNFQLTGVYDPLEERIQGFIKDWNLQNKNILTNWKEIQKAKFDFCVIASSSTSHLENFEFAIQSKIPYILLEKPVCTNLKELQKMLRLQKKSKAFVWVNHERRYHPVYEYVKKIIDSEKYGKLKTIRAAVLTSSRDPGLGFSKLGGGPLLHDGTHAIDYIDYLLEKEPKVEFTHIEKFHKNSIEKRAIVILQYPDNVIVFLEAGGERNYFQFELDIQTTHARFVLSNDGHVFRESKPSSKYKGFRSLEPLQIPKFSPSKLNPWIGIYSEILSHWKGKTMSIRGSLEANSRIFRTIQNIYDF